MWDAVALQGEKNWVHGLTIDPGLAVTEGRKDKWAQREAFRYMLAHPLVTARRSLIKLADFWGLEREFIAGARDGVFDAPSWFVVVAGAAILAAYIVVAVMGVAGAWLAPPADWRLHLLALLPAVFIMGIHALAFGHSRYHVPLVPILAVYAAALATRDAGRTPAPAARTAALISVVLLLLVWVRQVVFVDWDRIQALIGR